jgi:thioredoxin 1
MSKVIEVTDQIFEGEVLKTDLPTEVDFWAPWCGSCSDACSLKAIRMV